MSEDEEVYEDDDVVDEPEGEDEEGVSLDSAKDNVDASILAKNRERARIQAEIEAFLKSGGQIQQVESRLMSDPPRKPSSNYGAQPI